jgi:lipoprotein-anchoring transpeptidase ErfK/SrfK
LNDLAATINVPAQNATVQMVNGQLTPIAAKTGSLVDIDATIKALSADVEKVLADGKLDLVMQAQTPTVTDATPLIAKANALLAAPLTINLYNPVTNERLPLTFAPAQWGTWLTTTTTADGVIFTLDAKQFAAVIEAQQAQLGEGRLFKLDEVIDQAQQAIAAGSTTVNARIYNAPRQYTVQPGENLWSIAWDNGIVYWRIKEANPTINNWEALSAGQSIVIPSKDVMIPHPVVEGKRVIVSISQQRMWVYEGDQVKWEWDASTGIASSPTMPGIYQVVSHDGTAYASNWTLTMPSFMSIYEAVPGFSNGIHGFPWRNGNQILWENALGQRVTYGCILLSSANAELLYSWAEDGVIVEIKA